MPACLLLLPHADTLLTASARVAQVDSVPKMKGIITPKSPIGVTVPVKEEPAEEKKA